MLTDDKIEDILLTFEVMNPKDPWWHELAKALIEEAQPAIEQTARVEALEEAAKAIESYCGENVAFWCQGTQNDAANLVRDLINKEQAQ